MAEGTNKYHARRSPCGDHWHPSQKERTRCWTLQQKVAAGLITHLRRNTRWRLEVNGRLIGAYTDDFDYEEGGAFVVEDVKATGGPRSRDYPLRKRLMAALYGIDIREV